MPSPAAGPSITLHSNLANLRLEGMERITGSIPSSWFGNNGMTKLQVGGRGSQHKRTAFRDGWTHQTPSACAAGHPEPVSAFPCPLQTVTLDYLPISGPFPSFGDWAATSLRSFTATWTDFTGTIPASWSNLR